MGLVLLVILAGTVWLLPTAPQPQTIVPRPAASVMAFPPRPVPGRGSASLAARQSTVPRWDWLDSGSVVPAWYPRREFEEAPDLYRLSLSVVREATAGSPVHAYLLYLALDECHSFLRLDAQSIHALYERMLGVGSGLGPHEQAQWAEQFNRCVGFAVYDWRTLGESLGSERPGVSVEYAGAWFLRAVRGAHPPALVESAYRPGHMAAAKRREQVVQALDSGDPEVYWLLFLQAYERDSPAAQALALPWLRLACEAGLDCRFHAPWFQQRFCVVAPCRPAASSLAWFWQSLSAEQQEEAQSRFDQIVLDLEQERYEGLPLPTLPAESRTPPRR